MKFSDLKTGDLVNTHSGHKAIIMSDDLWVFLCNEHEEPEMFPVYNAQKWMETKMPHGCIDYSFVNIGLAAGLTEDKEITPDTLWAPYVISELEILEKVIVGA